MASLPPLSSEIFAEKVQKAQANSTAAAAKANFEKLCPACQKTYYSENAYQNHLQSQRHKSRVAAMEYTNKHAGADSPSVMSSTISLGEPLEPKGATNSADSESEPDFSTIINGFKQTKIADKTVNGRKLSTQTGASSVAPSQNRPPGSAADSGAASLADTHDSVLMRTSQCMFCNYDSPNLKLNVMHMSKFHALFIPEQPYLADLEGLIAYLQAKVGANHECLFCHKLKASTAGVQTHMRDKGHCMIAFDTEEEMVEVGQFYDFRSTYSDDEDAGASDDDDDHDERDGERDGDETGKDVEDGWETDSSASVATAEIGTVPIDPDYHRLASHKHHTHADPRPHRAADGFHSHAHLSHHAAFHADGELLLPTGRTAGHRALAKYYRQNLRHHPGGAGSSSDEGPDQRSITAGDGAGAAGAGGREVAHRGRSRRGVVTRADGGLGMLGATEAQKREARGAEQRAARRAQRHERHYQLGVSQRANHQKHFRDPLLQ